MTASRPWARANLAGPNGVGDYSILTLTLTLTPQRLRERTPRNFLLDPGRFVTGVIRFDALLSSCPLPGFLVPPARLVRQ